MIFDDLKLELWRPEGYYVFFEFDKDMVIHALNKKGIRRGTRKLGQIGLLGKVQFPLKSGTQNDLIW